jgi:hypothetical protein
MEKWLTGRTSACTISSAIGMFHPSYTMIFFLSICAASLSKATGWQVHSDQGVTEELRWQEWKKLKVTYTTVLLDHTYIRVGLNHMTLIFYLQHEGMQMDSNKLIQVCRAQTLTYLAWKMNCRNTVQQAWKKLKVTYTTVSLEHTNSRVV